MWSHLGGQMGQACGVCNALGHHHQPNCEAGDEVIDLQSADDAVT